VKVSTELTRARRSAATLALEPHPGSKGQVMAHFQIAELDKHNMFLASSKTRRRYKVPKNNPWRFSAVFVTNCAPT
jgi:hypothetical protein